MRREINAFDCIATKFDQFGSLHPSPATIGAVSPHVFGLLREKRAFRVINRCVNDVRFRLLDAAQLRVKSLSPVLNLVSETILPPPFVNSLLKKAASPTSNPVGCRV